MKSQIQQQLEIFKQNSVDVIPEKELACKLELSLSQNKPLKLKIGFDPTARDIHLGHTVLLRKLRKLQNLGHQVYLIIGDFTAKIGDPSGKSILRPVLSDEVISDNASTYTTQAFKILDSAKTTIIYNSIWYKDKKLSEFLSLLSSCTVARILERDDFTLRMKENKPLTLLETIYPLIQGYDSVMLDADVEFGGTDQKFNLLMGRHLQEVFGKKPQIIITMPILVGLDGANKMSKSLGNYVGVNEDPASMFGKIMSISDEVMWEYFRLLTDQDVEKIKLIHPKEAKLSLAQTISAFYHGQENAAQAREQFQRIFSEKKLPDDILVYKATSPKVDLLEIFTQTKLTASKNEARRLFTQEGVSLVDENYNLTVLTEQIIEIPSQGIILKLGKRKFIKIVYPE